MCLTMTFGRRALNFPAFARPHISIWRLFLAPNGAEDFVRARAGGGRRRRQPVLTPRAGRPNPGVQTARRRRARGHAPQRPTARRLARKTAQWPVHFIIAISAQCGDGRKPAGRRRQPGCGRPAGGRGSRPPRVKATAVNAAMVRIVDNCGSKGRQDNSSKG